MGDDISFPHMGAYGTTWVKTPGFDRVAENGILFNNAYTPNAKSSPSRACFLTGRNSWQLEEAGNHVPFFPPKFKTFMEALEQNGYYTGYTAKGWAPGVANDSTGKATANDRNGIQSKTLILLPMGFPILIMQQIFQIFSIPGKTTNHSASGTDRMSLTGNMNMDRVLKKGERACRILKGVPHSGPTIRR